MANWWASNWTKPNWWATNWWAGAGVVPPPPVPTTGIPAYITSTNAFLPDVIKSRIPPKLPFDAKKFLKESFEETEEERETDEELLLLIL